jgi:carboxylesterase
MSDGIERHLADCAGKTMPGAEPFFLPGGECGCLLLHGWGGSCSILRYLGQRLAAAGITAYAPLLPGHGTSPELMAQTHAADWTAAASRHTDTLLERCSAVFVAGISMGGALAFWLGSLKGERLKGIIPINPAVFLNNPELVALAFDDSAPAMLPNWDEGLIKDPDAKEVTYAFHPRGTIPDVLAIAKAAEELLPHLSIPVLLLQSLQDGILPAAGACLIFDRLRSTDKQLKWLLNSYHVATIDYDKDIIAEEIIRFIEERAHP